MDYMSASEADTKWGISKRRVQILCSENRISGAIKVGVMWGILKEVEKPLDKRVKNNN